MLVGLESDLFETVSQCSLRIPQMCYVAKDGFEFLIFLPLSLSAGITGMCQYTQLKLELQ